MIPTHTLFVDLFQVIGTPLPNATVRMTLTTYDIVYGIGGGLIPAGSTTIVCDENGMGEGELFPNTLGTRGTQYGVEVFNDGVKVFPDVNRRMALAVMPDQDSDLHAILFSVPPVSKSDADRAVLESRAWASQDITPVVTDPVPLYSAKYYAEQAANQGIGWVQVAEDWATFVGGEVPTAPPGSRSSRSWAQDNLIGVTYGGSARDWAMGNGLVDGIYKSARGYSLEAQDIALLTGQDRVATGQDRTQTGLDRVATGGDRTVTGQDRAATTASAGAAATSATTSTTQATASAASSLLALAASATAGAYPNSAGTNVPRGVVQAGVGAITAGAGGTNGTYMNGTTTGGNFLVPPTFKYVVAGGVLTSVTMLNVGLYIGAAPAVGTPTFTGSNLAGAGVVLTPSFLPDDGYWVASADAATLDRYQNVGGVATRDITVPSMPTATAAGAVTPGQSWSAQDGAGADALVVRSDGVTEACSMQVEELNGYGRTQLRQLFRPSDAYLLADIMGIFIYGDSIGAGQIDSATRLTTDAGAQPFGNLRFDGGVRQQDAGVGVVPTALVPLTETFDGSVQGETPASGMANKIVELLASENGMEYGTYGAVFFVADPSAGGSHIANLQKGQGTYTRFIGDVTNAKALANAAGKTFAVAAVLLVEGTNSMGQLQPPATWKTLTSQLIADFNADVKALIPGNPNIPFVAVQTNNHPSHAQYVNNPIIAQAGRELAATNPLYLNAVNMQYGDETRTPQAVHKTAAGQRIMGAMAAHAIKRVVIDRKQPSTLDLETAWAQGNVITANFKTDYPPIAFDVRWTLYATAMGFRVTDVGTVNAYGPGPGTTNTITSVTIVGPKTVRIVCANPITAGMRLQIAATGRTNLRDQRGEYDKYTVEGIVIRLDNFAMIADQVVQGV